MLDLIVTLLSLNRYKCIGKQLQSYRRRDLPNFMLKTKLFKPNRPGWVVLAAVVAMVPLLTAAAAGPTFNDPGFANTWNRADKPLLDLPGGAGRGYTWGPAFEPAAKTNQEP